MIKKKKQFIFLSLLLMTILLAAMVFTMVSCNNSNSTEDPNADSCSDVEKREKSFTFEVVYADRRSEIFTITTDKKTVGEALIEKGMISGEEGPYGIYVKTVRGETHEYNTDGTYWIFYVNDETAMTGVDSTDIVEGTKYSLKAEK